MKRLPSILLGVGAIFLVVLSMQEAIRDGWRNKQWPWYSSRSERLYTPGGNE